MNRTPLRDRKPIVWIVLAILGVALTTQVAMIATRFANRPEPTTRTAGVSLAQGDVVPAIPVTDAEGRRSNLTFARDDGAWTAVLVFKSTCAWCRTEGDSWREWMALEHAFDVVLLANEPFADALGFSNEFSWSRPLLVTDMNEAPAVRGLVSRTPWAFLVDSNGVVRYHGHGSGLAALDSVMLRLAAQ